MSVSYAVRSSATFDPDPQEPIMESIFKQYERVLVESLITSFGLDFLVKDQHGGDVDTIHNVRQIGVDEKMKYKNNANERDYNNRGKYNKVEYHKNPQFIEQNRKVSEEKANGTLKDSYTDGSIKRNEKVDLDHIIAAKEVHEDRGRVLAEQSGIDLANSKENLTPTNPIINRSMGKKTVDEYLEWLKETEPKRNARISELKSKPKGSLTGKEQSELNKLETLNSVDPQKMREADRRARKSYEAKLATAYYTGPKFGKDLALAAGNVGIRMGARQALGFVFTEMWFSVKEEFQSLQGEFDLGKFCIAIGNGIKRGFERAKEKYAELISKFFGGALAGALSSLTTTLCNIFFTTAKNVVRIIRQSYASLVQAGKVLFINPDNYTFGERMRAVAKILATGASVVVGTVVSEAVSKTAICSIPVVKDIVPAFCGTFVTGILSCTLLYFFDRSELMNKLFKALDGLHTIETEINYFREQAAYFEQYAAQLMEIDLAQFQREVALYGQITCDLEKAETEQELSFALKRAYDNLDIAIPWKGHDSFNSFMEDKSARLVFE